YNNGLLQKIIDYKYNAKNQLEAEYYFNPSRKPLGYKEYKYHTDGNLKLSNTYLGKKLSLTTEYDNFGRVIKIEKYNKQEMVINQTRTSYNDNGRTERIYNKNNILITKANYTSDNQLKELIKYDNDREIYSEVYDFENGVKKSGKILSFGNLIKQFDYDANGILVKESKLNQGKLISYTVYKYNDKGLISDATQYSSSNKVLSDWKYHYTKKNQISKEETYIGNKLLFKSIYSYNNSGHKTSTKFYKENLPIKIEYYNKVGKLDKLIIYKKGQPFNTVIYQYKKGRLIQQKLYNLINELERIITFEYGLDAKTKLPIKKEHGFDRKKQYLGSIVTYYNSQGQITRKEFYDHSKLLYEIIHFDSMGNVARTEKAENRDN
ncbi:MAG: hypothetical protein OEV44_10220, partial [Spirochaetota bacterium]|nr:hypothetical protein [Spirochaetota bacterium]